MIGSDSGNGPITREFEPLTVARLAAQRGRLQEWLVGAAYPLWASRGIDSVTGSFHEALDLRGTALGLPRRARVQPRQIYAFAYALTMGWRGDVAGIVRRGVEAMVSQYRRDDGLYRSVVASNGSIIDERALLYDQAFVLLGFAAAAEALDARGEMESIALDLRAKIESLWRVEDGVFASGEGVDAGRRDANPHMHLLEACLAWARIGADAGWVRWADELADTAVRRFIMPDSGALVESFAEDWTPLQGRDTSQVEPGHQYEWAWLLMRCRQTHRPARYAAALRLIDVAERHGVRHGYAINALGADLAVRDPDARLWPQTERIKAAQLAFDLSGDPRYSAIAGEACARVFRYLDTDTAGLWFDVHRSGGCMDDTLVPASTLYHLVGAVRTLGAGRP